MKTLTMILLSLALAAPAVAAEEVNLYTDRQEVFLRPVLAAFEQQTGIKTNVLFAKKGLLERMRAEGDASPADVVMAVDVGRLQDFVTAGLIAEYGDETLRAVPPPGYATPHWVAVTRRARILYVRPQSAIDGYDDLAAAAQRGAVCIRPAKHAYNIGLFADLIQRQGEAEVRRWLEGVKENLARPPQGNDRAQINGVADGDCGVGLANSYYYFQLIKDPEKRAELEAKVKVVIPDGAHINVTGVGLAAHAPHRENGLRLMRFLLSAKAQNIYATENGEFPVNPETPFPPALAPFRQALTNAAVPADIADYRAAASRLVEEVGLDRQ